MSEALLPGDLPETIRFEDGCLSVLDQRLLPGRCEYLELPTLEDAWQAIQTLSVRGAPAIGITAAYALAQSMRTADAPDRAQLERNAAYLKSARPTAVNLAWACEQMLAAYDPANPDALLDTARRIDADDRAACLAIGKYGAPLIQPGYGVLTHCNAGSLAVSRLGTATAPMYHQHAAGVKFRVYADETRPLYQGARLTAWELDRAGIDVRLICDNMAATLMARGEIDLVIVGTDRVTANGDVVNKIGTLNVAILCQHFGLPFYVACPTSTLDHATPTGAEVEIEERDPAEVRGTHAADVAVCNPAFDVTPATLVHAIITEAGVFKPEQIASLAPKS